MVSFELVLIIFAGVAPFVALLFMLPKIKKKHKQVETKPYVSEKMPTVQEVKEHPKIEKPISSINDELEDYRQYLQKRKLNTDKPVRLEVPEEYRRTEEYSAFRRRRRIEEKSNQDIHSLTPEVKAMLIAGILDRKF